MASVPISPQRGTGKPQPAHLLESLRPSISAPTAKSNPSYIDASRQSAPATPAPATQIQMDRFIESELHNAIFHDPKFIDRFLSGDVAKLDQVHEKCGNLDNYYGKKGQWKLPSIIRTEKSLYNPVLDILNTIKSAVDTVNPLTRTSSSSQDHEPAIPDNSDLLTSDDDPSDSFIPDQPQFIDTSTYTIGSDRAETKLIKPDLALFEDVDGKHRHWEHVRMPIEIKKLTGYHKAAMKQLSRYARAVFAHQLHRRHLYAMMVCNTEATFVRFDRAGILYSRRINLRTDSKAFTYAFASLLMLVRTDQGYDPAFTCEMNQDGRLDYYVDLPTSAFATQKPNPKPAASGEAETHRFMVVDRLCHRRSICGRATIVLRIRQLQDNDGDEYILKIMWHDPERSLEGEVLRKVKGKFGLAQYVWHGDAFGKCRCSPIIDGRWGCTKCVAETVQLDELEVCDELTDIAIEVPPEDEQGDKDPELKVVDTTVCHPTSRRRPHRICVFLVISSIGVSLEKAESPRQFMQAVLDAILGYWGLFNIGILHRDISEGNVLMLRPGQQLDRGDNRLDDTEITDEVLAVSEKKLRDVLDRLGRKPTGMLSDLDLCCTHSLVSRGGTPTDTPESSPTSSRESKPRVAPPSPVLSAPSSSRTSGFVRSRDEDTTGDMRGSKRRKTLSRPDGILATTRVGPTCIPTRSQDVWNRMIDFRTGTPAFMSIRVIKVPAGESMLNLLNQQDPNIMTGQKKSQLGDCIRTGNAMRNTLKNFSNSWASDPLFTEVILKFGKLAHQYHYDMVDEEDPSPVDVFPAVVDILQNALSSHPE